MLDTAYKYTYGNKEERWYILEAAHATPSPNHVHIQYRALITDSTAAYYCRSNILGVTCVTWSESETVHIHTYRILSRYVSNYPLIALIWITIAGL